MSGRLAVLMLMVALGAGAAVAEDSPPAAGTPQEEPASAAASASGLLIAIDPATGELRAPTAQEAKTLAAGMSLTLKDAGQGLVPVVWPDGTVTVDLDESYMFFSVASVDADGAPTLGCVDHPAATDLPVAVTAAPAPLEEK